MNSEKKRLIMSNPKNFVTISNSMGVFYEHLLEGKECLGITNLARLFEGNSSRGGINATCIECWINTFEYLNNNPNHIDNEIPKPFSMKPTQNYFKFVSEIKKNISNEVIESWKTLSNKKLADEASKYNYSIGTKNAKAVQTLLQRMIKMVERRNKNIWTKTFLVEVQNENQVINYNMKNVPELRLICKERNLANAHLKKKDELVKLLEDNPLNTVHDEVESVDYSKFNSRELKNLAKTRKLTNYNNLKKDELIKLHKDYDEDVKMIEKEKDSESNDDIKDEEQIIISDGSTLNKIFNFNGITIRTTGTSDNPLFVTKDICDVLELSQTNKATQNIPDKWKGRKSFPTLGGDQEMSVINEPGLYKLIMRSNKPIAEKFQEFVCEDVLPSIRKTGSYNLEDKYKFILDNNRPLSQVMNNTDIDKEAIEIEKLYNWSKNSNCAIIYIAYIGDGLVKIGFSDSKFDERLCKHISCESKYKQFVILETFEVSGKPVEDQIHNLLNHYRFSFERQKEIYKPTSCLKKFIKNIEELLNDNDFKLKYNKLLEKHNELEKKYLMLQLG
jgi:prophage antirepressor-like protein